MLIEMLFLKITMTSTFISSALCRGWLYNGDYIRCDEQLCSSGGTVLCWGRWSWQRCLQLKLLQQESLLSVPYNFVTIQLKFSMLVLSLASQLWVSGNLRARFLKYLIVPNVFLFALINYPSLQMLKRHLGACESISACYPAPRIWRFRLQERGVASPLQPKGRSNWA